MHKILLFCDPGIDDCLAIIYALLHPDINLVGVVTSYGNVSAEQATSNAAYLLSLAGRSDIPIFYGANFPLSGELATYYPEIHGEDGIGPIVTPSDLTYNVTPFCELFPFIEKHIDDIKIIDTGRSTSLAMAFNFFNGLMKQVKEVYLMGGAFFVPGNVTSLAEANFHGDPFATKIVLEHAQKVYITPLNVTNRAVINSQIAEYVSQNARNPYTKIILDTSKYYISAYHKLNPRLGGAALHDLFTLYYLINKENIDSVEKRVWIELYTASRGVTFMDFRTPENEPNSPHTVALDFDYERFIIDFINVMTRPLKQ